MRFVVTDDIFATFPDVRIGVLVARGIKTPPSFDLSDALAAAQERVRTSLAGTNVTDHPRIHSWREACGRGHTRPFPPRDLSNNLNNLRLSKQVLRRAEKEAGLAHHKRDSKSIL